MDREGNSKLYYYLYERTTMEKRNGNISGELRELSQIFSSLCYNLESYQIFVLLVFQVCDTVTELECNVYPYEKCELKWIPVDYTVSKNVSRSFPINECKEVEVTKVHRKKVPVCRNETKQNCVTLWKKDKYGKKVSHCLENRYSQFHAFFNQNGIFKLNNSTCFQSNDRYGQVMRIAKTSPGRFVIWFGKSLISPLQKMNVGPARKLQIGQIAKK